MRRRAVAIPAPWEDEAGEALAALAPGSGPATLPSVAEAWIQRLTLRGRRLGLLDGADAAESLAAGLRALILARRGAPGAEIWRDARGEGRFVLNPGCWPVSALAMTAMRRAMSPPPLPA